MDEECAFKAEDVAGFETSRILRANKVSHNDLTKAPFFGTGPFFTSRLGALVASTATAGDSSFSAIGSSAGNGPVSGMVANFGFSATRRNRRFPPGAMVLVGDGRRKQSVESHWGHAQR